MSTLLEDTAYIRGVLPGGCGGLALSTFWFFKLTVLLNHYSYSLHYSFLSHKYLLSLHYRSYFDVLSYF